MDEQAMLLESGFQEFYQGLIENLFAMNYAEFCQSAPLVEQRIMEREARLLYGCMCMVSDGLPNTAHLHQMAKDYRMMQKAPFN